MENNNFDRQISQKLRDADVPPPDFVWQNVEQRLQRRRRRMLAFWLFGGLLLTTFTFSYSNFFNQKMENANSADAILHNNLNNLNDSQTQNQSANAQIKTSELPTAVDEPSSKPHFSKKGGAFHHPNLLKLSTPSLEVLPKNVVDAMPMQQTSTAEKLEMPVQQIATTFSENIEQLPRSLVFLANSDDKHPNFTPFEIKKINKNRRYKAYFFEGFAAPMYTHSLLQARSDDFKHYQKQRETSEKYAFGASAGLRAGWVRGNWVLRTGLNYAQFTERFDFEATGVAKVSTENEIIYIDGVPQNQVRTLTTFGVLNQTIFNRFGALEVPLTLGFEKRWKKWGIGVHAGASANVLFWKKGEILDLQPQQIDVPPTHSDLSPAFKNRIAGNFEGSVQAFYKLKNGTRVFAEPYFQQSMQPVSATDAPVEQRFQMFGLRFGARKVFD